jgi:hypothetical protein
MMQLQKVCNHSYFIQRIDQHTFEEPDNEPKFFIKSHDKMVFVDKPILKLKIEQKSFNFLSDGESSEHS